MEEDVEFDVDLDIENVFPDILGSPKESKSWDDLQAQPPIPLRAVRPIIQDDDDDGTEGPTTRGQDDDEDDDGTDGGQSQRTFNTLEKIYSGENENGSYQSYGYSLEEGVASKPSISLASASASAGEASGPMKMDLYALNSQRYNFTEDDDTLEVSVATPGSIYSGLTIDDASAAAGKKPARSPDRNMAASSSAPEVFIRECMAPAGKLGVVIDTTRNGPVVHQVKAGSPLENVVFAGDRIIAIDDIDTRGMTASNVTKIMARKCDEPRKIKISSKTFTGNF